MAKWLTQRFSEIGADDVLVAKLRTDGRSSQLPFKPAVEVQSYNIGAVEVVRHFVLRTANQFEAVFTVVPVDGRLQVQLVSLSSCTTPI